MDELLFQKCLCHKVKRSVFCSFKIAQQFNLSKFIFTVPVTNGGVHSLKSKMHVQNSIKVLSANCQDLRNQEKKIDVLTYFKENKVNILCLQDTHLIENYIPELKKLWDGEIYLSGSKTNSCGVAVFLIIILSIRYCL